MSHCLVIEGPMFSGKSGHLATEIDHAIISETKTLIIKPKIDTRTRGVIAKHTRMHDGSLTLQKICDAIEIDSEETFIRVVSEHHFEVLIADECQFFPSGKPNRRGQLQFGWFGRQVKRLLDENANKDNFRIILAGLGLDYKMDLFGAMPELLALADQVIKTKGVCMNRKCRKEARFSHRLIQSRTQIIPGDKSIYEVRCRVCHSIV